MVGTRSKLLLMNWYVKAAERCMQAKRAGRLESSVWNIGRMFVTNAEVYGSLLLARPLEIERNMECKNFMANQIRNKLFLAHIFGHIVYKKLNIILAFSFFFFFHFGCIAPATYRLLTRSDVLDYCRCAGCVRVYNIDAVNIWPHELVYARHGLRICKTFRRPRQQVLFLNALQSSVIGWFFINTFHLRPSSSVVILFNHPGLGFLFHISRRSKL